VPLAWLVAVRTFSHWLTPCRCWWPRPSSANCCTCRTRSYRC
jgi:hypothetical protein